MGRVLESVPDFSKMLATERQTYCLQNVWKPATQILAKALACGKRLVKLSRVFKPLLKVYGADQQEQAEIVIALLVKLIKPAPSRVAAATA